MCVFESSPSTLVLQMLKWVLLFALVGAIEDACPTLMLLHDQVSHMPRISRLSDAPPREEQQQPENVAGDSCASIVSHSATVQSASSLLREGLDSYMLMDVTGKDKGACFVTIKLCRQVTSLARVELRNQERFSSRVRRVQVWGRREQGWPWLRISTTDLEDRLGSHMLPLLATGGREIGELMIRIESHYGAQYYAALTRLVVESVESEDDEDDEDDALLSPEATAALLASKDPILELRAQLLQLQRRVAILEKKK